MFLKHKQLFFITLLALSAALFIVTETIVTISYLDGISLDVSIIKKAQAAAVPAPIPTP